jgi:replicative DNA helicase
VKKIESTQKLLLSGKLSGCPTGILELDRATYGWQNSDYIVIAGNPGEGKTTLALQSAISAAEAGIPVYFISAEMARSQLMLKQFSYYSGVDGQRLRVGNVNDSDWPEINKASTRIEKLKNFFIDDTPNTKFGQIKVKCRKYKALHKIGLIVIDYLQLINSKEGRNKADDISIMSKGFKSIAKELDVPVIVISSLSKESTKSGDKRPHPGHLKESGDIWYDADVVATVYRPEKHNIEQFKTSTGETISSTGLAVIDIWKQRMGSEAEILTNFIGSQNKFMTYSPQAEPKSQATGVRRDPYTDNPHL